MFDLERCVARLPVATNRDVSLYPSSPSMTSGVASAAVSIVTAFTVAEVHLLLDQAHL
jgi:hypothetical protein